MGISTSKKILVIAGVILALFIGVAADKNFNFNNTAPPANSPAVDVVKEVILENKGENLLLLRPKDDFTSLQTTDKQSKYNNGDLVKIIRVIDGDTIEIQGGDKVRYIGVDTPETIDPRKPVQCFGIEAFNKNKELVEGKMAQLEKDITERDKYGRLLRYVWVGDVFINLELIKQGFAYSYSYPPDIKYQDLFIKAQQEAREAKRGLWGTCPVAAPAKAQAPVLQENNFNDSCVIKGNISASGEKIYHLPGCGSYEKTKIDGARGEKWFCAESEALVAGWRKALNCP